MNTSLISQLRYSEDSQPQHSHFHLTCEMIFVVSGQAEFEVDGRHYLASKGSIVFINSYEKHNVCILSQPYRRYFAMVQAAELEHALPSSVLPGIFKNRPAGFSHCVSPNSFGDEPERLFSALLREVNSENFYAEQMVRTLLEQILILVYRACPQNFALLESNANKRIREVQQYIEQHFTEPIHVAELADRFLSITVIWRTRLNSWWGAVPNSTFRLTGFPMPKNCWKTPTFRCFKLLTSAAFLTRTTSFVPFETTLAFHPTSTGNQSSVFWLSRPKNKHNLCVKK